MQNQLPETGIGVKRPNTTELLTKAEFDQRVLNIVKSKRDIVWWAEQFFHIVTLDKGLTKIQLYNKQKELLQHLVDNNRTIVLSARQTGKCIFRDSKIKIRNKKTNEITEVKISDFFKNISREQK